MLLLTIVYDSKWEKIVEEISRIKQYFKAQDINIGIAESEAGATYFIKLFCDDSDYNKKFINTFNILIGNVFYNIIVDEFITREMQRFLTDTYFFLKYDEINEIKKIALSSLKNEGPILDETSIYCLNRKNSTVSKIIRCIEENNEINVKGFITFRMKELKEDIENIIDKIVEKYMVEKEYDEFIKLLKYFVEIQESKIDEVNILIQSDSSYIIKDKEGNDVSDKLFSELSEARYTGIVSIDDMLISGLITNSPKKIIIHCVENCTNKELIDTIKSVFLERVIICDSCKYCQEIKIGLKV